MQAFLFYIDDWLSSKQIEMMDAVEERGYLRLLLRAAKEPDCGLPDDDAQLAIMSMIGFMQWNRPTADKAFRIGKTTSGEKLRKCFVIKDGRLYNERLLREFENQKRVREARRLSGIKGGRPPKQTETNCLANGLANGKQTETNHSLGLGLSNYEEEIPYSKNPPAPQSPPASAFDPIPGWTRFKLAYPSHRINEYMDMQLWMAIVDSEEVQELIISRVKERKATHEWQKDNGKFVPKASRFLGEREFNIAVEPRNNAFSYKPDEERTITPEKIALARKKRFEADRGN